MDEKLFRIALPDTSCIRQAKFNLLELKVIPRKEKIGGGILLVFHAEGRNHQMLLNEESREHLVKLLSVPMDPVNLENEQAFNLNQQFRE